MFGVHPAEQLLMRLKVPKKMTEYTISFHALHEE